MNDNPLYNSRIISTYIEFLKSDYPEININSILKEANIAHYQLEDEGHWFTQREVDTFYDLVFQKTKNQNIARDAGRYIAFSQTFGVIRQYAIGFLSPTIAYWMLEKLASSISRHTTLKTKKIGRNKVEIIALPKEGVKEKKYQCENRIGMLEALAKIFTQKYALIEQPECIHEGHHHCRYIVSWDMTSALIWKRIANYFSLIALLTCTGFYFVLPLLQWIILALSSIIISGVVFFASERMERNEFSENIESQSNAADLLINQINRHYNEAQLIQEIGQATSSIMDIEKLLTFIMDTLEKRLDFDRGIIMLANRDRTRLMYTAGYGYNPTMENYLKNIEFNLANPDSKGEFVKVFKIQKPVMIYDIKEIEQDLSQRTIKFVKKLGSQSFICVPIIYEGKSEGIMAVDNIGSKKPFDQSDLNLLLGIAPQIGISINNARSYQLIRDREESFRALSENAPDIIYTLDINGMFTYINPAWEKILGHPKENVFGKRFTDFVQKDDIDVYIELFEKVREKKATIIDFNGIFVHQNGTERLFNMNGAPNFDSEGNVTGIVGILKDITEQYNMEVELRQAQKMQAIGTLSAGIAHDFNNILTPIIGYTELIMSESMEQTQTKWMMERILNASHRAKELVRQILTFSRQTDQERKPVQVSLIIKEALRLLRASLPTTIEIRQNIASESLVVGDPTQIHQVLMNLCTNAGHAMQENGGILEVSLIDVHLEEESLPRYPQVVADSYIRLTVSDTGYGMPPNVLERIFDPFFTTKERSKGTGMGLSVVHGIVENHGGIISVSSEPGKGSTFNVYLPVFFDETAITSDTAESLPAGSERILFVDDELPVVETGKHVLETLGYNVTTRTSSVEALELFKVKPNSFDLVITDMTMPNMTGDKLAKELLDIRSDIPIIICTGYSSLINKEKAEDMGIRAYIMKPMLKSEIAQAIRTALNPKEMQ